MVFTPFATTQADLLQQFNLPGDGLAVRLPAAVVFQPVGNIIVGQLRFRLDGRREELNIVFDGSVISEDHAAGQHWANRVGAQRAEVVRELARQHRNVEARQIVGKGANFRRVVQLAAFGNPGGRIGDSDGQVQFTVSVLLDVQRIVHIFGAGAIDGHESQFR